MPEPTELDRLVAVFAAIRVDWPSRSIRTYLGENHQHSGAHGLLVAGAACYGDPLTKTPARLREAGPWWKAAQAASGEVDQTSAPPRHLPEDDRPPQPDEVAHRGAAVCRELLGDDETAATRQRQARLGELLGELRHLWPTLTEVERRRVMRATQPDKETA